MSLVLVVKVQFLGASSPGIDFSWFVHSQSSAVTAPWCLLPAAEPTHLGQGMNAYKYQKFLEGLNNLRGIQAALADCVSTSG